MKSPVFLVILILNPLTEAAFGDRIRPITQSPLYTRRPNYKSPTTTSTTTTPLPLDPSTEYIEDVGSPESPSSSSSDDLTSGSSLDSSILSEEEVMQDLNLLNGLEGSNGIYPDSEDDQDDDTIISSSSSTTTMSPSLYPLDPPEVLSSTVTYAEEFLPENILKEGLRTKNDNISSSGTYSRLHYAVPPLQQDQVVFLSSLQPKHPLSVYPPVKKVVKVLDGLPTYKDSGPRIRYIRKKVVPFGTKLPPHARYPTHMHPAKVTPLGAIPSHSHEYHHHPTLYGYIPGIPGRPWKDYPMFSEVPKTGFSCKLTKYPGFYADIDAGCQVWHYCQLDGRHDKFLCPNGTIFNQATRVCEWWYNVDCPSSIWKYDINADLYKTTKKVLHIHPGKKPHIHKLPKKGNWYVFQGAGGTKKTTDLSTKVHKHHFEHHPRPGGKSPFVPRTHPLAIRPPYDHHPHDEHKPPRLPGLKIRKVVVPSHHAHTIRHKMGHNLHTINHMPIGDPLEQFPNHGHLILHQVKKKK